MSNHGWDFRTGFNYLNVRKVRTVTADSPSVILPFKTDKVWI